MDEEEHAAETKLTTSFNDGDEFVENATTIKIESASSPSASTNCDKKWLWLHAAFHCIVAMVVSATWCYVVCS